MTYAFAARADSRIENNSDDAYQTGTTVDISAQTVSHASTGDLIGFRFLDLGVPKGATITKALLRVDIGSGNGNPDLQIHCQKLVNPATFTTASNNIGSRTLTDASTTWQAGGLPNGVTFSPDFKSAVQEVVNLSGWAAGSGLAVILVSNANTNFSIRAKENTAFGRATLIVEYTLPVPILPTIYSVSNSSIKNSTSRSMSVSIPTAGGTRVYAIVQAVRYAATFADSLFDITAATLHGSPMTLLESVSEGFSSFERYRVNLYEVVDPLDSGSNPSTQTLSVTLSKSALAIAITVVVVTGVTERGDAVSVDTAGLGQQPPELSLNVDADLFPGLILAGGVMRRKGTALQDLNAFGDGGSLLQYSTGTATNDVNAFVGGVNAVEPGTYEIGWSWTNVDWSPGGSHSIIVGVPLYGRVEIAEAEFSGINPVVVYGDATLDGLAGAAEFSAFDPTVVLGSIPPVQVAGRGALYLSTASRTLTTCLLATNGDDWVITDSGGDVEQLSVRIKRRSGYLTPV